jgi:hypothetical protein
MRTKKMAFLSCALVGVVGLTAAPAAMATDYCGSFNPAVTVLKGPCPVTSATPGDCASSGPYTGIQYAITGSPSYIATVVTANNTFVPPANSRVYGACVGDPETGLGRQSCHEKAIRFNCASNTTTFWVVVQGQKTATLQSVAAKKGYCTKSVAVDGLGFDVNPFQIAQKKETVNFKGCAVTFQYSTTTGEVTSAALDPSQSTKPVCAVGQNDGTCCAFNGGEDVRNLTLLLNDRSLGAGQFGEGYVSSGTDSCTTRVIGGRVYTWGSPCPE